MINSIDSRKTDLIKQYVTLLYLIILSFHVYITTPRYLSMFPYFTSTLYIYVFAYQSIQHIPYDIIPLLLHTNTYLPGS